MSEQRVRQKATAIVLANRAKRAGETMQAATLFREAAALERETFEELAARGRADFLVNAISCVACWIEAGEFQQALAAAGRALSLAEGKDLDPALVQELCALAESASEADARRWYEERKPEPGQGAPEPIPIGVEHQHLLEEYRSKLEELPASSR